MPKCKGCLLIPPLYPAGGRLGARQAIPPQPPTSTRTPRLSCVHNSKHMRTPNRKVTPPKRQHPSGQDMQTRGLVAVYSPERGKGGRLNDVPRPQHTAKVTRDDEPVPEGESVIQISASVTLVQRGVGCGDAGPFTDAANK